nr:MAG: hypothetical protein [Apis mellifera filamentous virus]
MTKKSLQERRSSAAPLDPDPTGPLFAFDLGATSFNSAYFFRPNTVAATAFCSSAARTT